MYLVFVGIMLAASALFLLRSSGARKTVPAPLIAAPGWIVATNFASAPASWTGASQGAVGSRIISGAAVMSIDRIGEGRAKMKTYYSRGMFLASVLLAFSMGAAATVKIPDTGQNRCYNNSRAINRPTGITETGR
jgi:hypothetical protein